MATSTTEVILRFTGDPRHLRDTIAAVRRDLSGLGQAQVAAARTAGGQIVTEAARSEQRRVAETIKSANQRLREEQRAAREVARIVAETARQAERQERIRERAAKQLADVQIREAKRAAKELEKTLAASRGGSGGGGGGFDISGAAGLLGRIPGLSSLSSELSSVTSASASAGAATASLAGPIGLAVAAFAAEAAVVATVTVGLFDLAKQTADYRGKLFDLSQQIGLSVETLSGLEILATTTGGTIENVAASVAIFQRNLEDSHDPTSTEAKLLKELGVTSTETEEALRQTLTALFAMGEGSAQTAAVLQLFGRSGRFVNAILKESQGDLTKAIAKFRELGIIVSTEDAKAADEFNDTLATLNFQLRGMTALIGQEVMPVVLDVLTDLQKLLRENKDAVEALGAAAKVTAVLLGAPFKGSLIGLQAILGNHRAELALIVALYEQWAELLKTIRDGVPDVSANAIPAQLLGAEDGLKLLQRAQEAFRKAQDQGLKQFNLKEIFGVDKDKTADPGIALLRQLQTELSRLTTETKAQEVAQQLLGEQFKGTSSSLRTQILAVAGLIDLQRAQVEVEKKIQEATEKRSAAILQERSAVISFMDAQGLALQGPLSELDKANRFIAQILASSGNISGILDEATISAIRFSAALQDSKNIAQKMLEILRESAEQVPAPGGPVPVTPEQEAGNVVSPEQDAALQIEVFGQVIEQLSLWEEAMASLKSQMVDFSDFLGTTFIDSLHGIAGALAEGVASWALYGGSFAKAMKQALAALGAKIAAEAIMMAAIHAAYAIGSLAFGDFGAAAKHAIAAAKFAAIGGVAALATRAIAGNDFASSSANGNSSTAPDRGAPRAPSAQPRTQEFDRNTRNEQSIVRELTFKVKGDAVIDKWVEDFHLNGRTRVTIMSERDA